MAVILAAALGCVRPGAALAADAEAEVAAGAAVAAALVDTLVVGAGPGPGLAVPAPAALVTRLDLADAVGYRDLADLLGSVAGFQTARLGGWGEDAVPSLRGSSAAQVRFFLDGLPLPDARTGRAGFARLPLERLAAVEVHRGVVPAPLGGSGGSGAVNLVTRTRDEGWDASVSGGSFGEMAGRLGWGATSADGTRGGLVLVHGHRADNDFAFLDHNQTFHRSDDDTVRIRRNADLAVWGVWGSGRWDGGDLQARVAGGFTRRDGGRPGPLGAPSPEARVRYDRLDGRVHLAWRGGLLTADAGGGRSNEFLYDPAGQVGLAPAGVTHAADRDLSGRLAWAPRLWSGRLGLVAGTDWRELQHDMAVGDRSEPARTRRVNGLFAAADLALAGGRLTVAPAWRWQRMGDLFPAAAPLPWLKDVDLERDDVSPALGVVWEVRPGRVFVEAHAARTVRAPSWLELFGTRGGVDGNAALLPERLRSADVAVSVRPHRRLHARLAAFTAVTEDKIAFVQNGPRSTKALNLDRTEAEGLEAEVGLRLPSAWRLDANLTLQRVRETGGSPVYEGKDVPLLPDAEAHVRLSGRTGEWEPWVTVLHMGANFRDRANTDLGRAPARTLLNLGVARDVRPALLGPAGLLHLRLEVINLTDNAVYDVEGYPLPGRTWRAAAGLRY